MMPPLMNILMASLIPPTWAATPTRPGGRRTHPTRRPGGEDRRQEGGRRGRAAEEGIGCQEESDLGMYYSGTANTTESGNTCQAWTSMEPHEHKSQHYGDHNYCRNYGEYDGGVWCYTTDPNIRHEICAVPLCPRQTVKLIDFSLAFGRDMDFGQKGNWSGATLEKADLPPSFTICAAYSAEAWTTEFTQAHVWELMDDNGLFWGYMSLYISNDATSYEVWLGESYPYILAEKTTILFPLQWTRICVSLDTDSALMTMVADGEMMGQEGYTVEEYMDRPSNLSISAGDCYTGRLSTLNIFSSALSLERMVEITTAGGEECGAPGDFLSWEEAVWTLHFVARILEVHVSEGPCGRESKIQVFTADFGKHSECMEHCEKIGNGRSPPVVTLEQWEALAYEMLAVTPETSSIPTSWLAAIEGSEGPGGVGYPLERLSHWPETIEPNETVWRDYYTGERIEEYPKPYMWDHDNWYGEDCNCMLWHVDTNWDTSWDEWTCHSFDMACPCQYQQQPLLRLRGLCWELTLDTLYTPVQLPMDPANMMLVGQTTSRIEYNASSSQWILTDAKSSVIAKSRATKQSYVLGKHTWTIINDKSPCNPLQKEEYDLQDEKWTEDISSFGQPYTLQLKLTGCREEEFTCADGQCIMMEKRCNQLPDCSDNSDERGCQMLLLEDGYNMKVPPITAVSETDSTVVPVPVHISILLMKVVKVEEVEHKIDLQFQIILQWKENRATFTNIKEKTSLNSLTDDAIYQLWLPDVVYDNTDQKESTQLGYWKTSITITRKGNFTRVAGWKDADEAEVFQGAENELTMQQTYTHNFQCEYMLHRYPFDTQVGSENILCLHFVRCAQL